MSVGARLSHMTGRILGMAAAGAASLIVLVISSPGVLEAWLLGFILLAGLSAGALVLLLTGHILGEIWLQPIRAELEAVADLVPMVAILAVPILVYHEALYPWAGSGGASNWLDPEFFLIRSALYLGVWVAVASLAKQRHYGPVASAIGLVVLIPSISLGALDWLGSREPEWISGLYGPAFAVSQMLAAMAFGLLVTLIRPGHPGRLQAESLRTAMLTLALLTLWTWFSQFLIVWMANLPAESAWYLDRARSWLLIEILAISALMAAIVLLFAPHAGPARLAAITGLLIVQHVAHLIWLIRPTALHAVPPALDIAVLTVMVGLWLVFLMVELTRRPNLSLTAPARV